MATASSISAFSSMIDSFGECLTPETAERIVAFRMDPRTQARLDELADKANEGLLTEPERNEYSACVELIDFIGILQVRARTILEQRISLRERLRVRGEFGA